jgi:thymidylate synthase
MKQYLELLEKIQKKGTYKPAARTNMPGTLSLFGEQLRFDLQEGFPMVTTKKVSFKNIVVELLWFLKGDTNIKYLVDNGCNIWNEDAYNYYKKIFKGHEGVLPSLEEFIQEVKTGTRESNLPNYTYGDCGKQYGWLWRRWENPFIEYGNYVANNAIDQLKDLIEGLKTNPMSRRHVITAWNPATLDDMALNACHAFVQFNCRPVYGKSDFTEHNGKKYYNLNERNYQRLESFKEFYPELYNKIGRQSGITPYEEMLKDKKTMDDLNISSYYLDCQLYQRSADVVLGVPYNIASYALLTEILAKICNMIPGEFVHTFGDVHIYENHLEAVKEQLEREPKFLPTLKISEEWLDFDTINLLKSSEHLTALFHSTLLSDFSLENYNPHPKLKTETKLSTGL